MSERTFTTHAQASAYSSPWTRKQKVMMQLWGICWALFCAWTPKPANSWRQFWLRLFGANIHPKAFIHSHARVQIPWNLTMGEHACLGDGANAYTLGPAEIKAHATVAQEAYLCTGTHDFADPALPLMTAKITVEEHAFIGVRAVVMPGVTIGRGSVIGGASVVTKDTPEWTICAGNPAKPIKPRPGNWTP